MILDFVGRLYHRFLGSKELSYIEKRCIDEWRNKLNANGAAIIDWQINQYDLVQRSRDGTVVSFYLIGDNRCSSLPDKFRFPSSGGDALTAASIYLTCSSKNKKPLKADIILISGRFFGIEFSSSPLSYFDESDYADLKVQKVTSWHDPMVFDEKIKSAGKEMLRTWPSDAEIMIFKEKYSELLNNDQLNALRDSLDVGIPPDYLLLGILDANFEVSGWSVLRVDMIRKTFQSNGNYYILAEQGEYSLGIKQGETSGTIYHMRADDAFKVETSFKEAISKTD